MAKHAPIFAASKTAAKLFELTEAEFLTLVKEGVLPTPQAIGPYERWDVDQLAAIARGERADEYGVVEW